MAAAKTRRECLQRLEEVCPMDFIDAFLGGKACRFSHKNLINGNVR
jgi:hypothetical protein